MVKKRDVEFRSQGEIDRDFKIYEAGVLKLKDLENVLNHLNTLGFWKDEQKIRAKLGNLGDIPIIEKELEALEKKITKKHGKKGLYRTLLSPLKRKKVHKKKKKEVIVGDVPEPVNEDATEPVGQSKKSITKTKVEKSTPLFRKILPLAKKKGKARNYEKEVKDAIGDGDKKSVVVDSTLEASSASEEGQLSAQRATLRNKELALLKKEKTIAKNYEKYHDLSLGMDRYSADKAGARDAVNRLIDFRRNKDKKRFYRDVAK
ncbi:hypothetical protein HN747_03630 [archaeon]|nr:hypothetical protein [archaeon]